MRKKVVDPAGYLESNRANFTPYKVIPGGHITTEGMAFPIYANGQLLQPNTGDYMFPTNEVIETPAFRGGGKYRKWYQQGGEKFSDSYQPNWFARRTTPVGQILGSVVNAPAFWGNFFQTGIKSLYDDIKTGRSQFVPENLTGGNRVPLSVLQNYVIGRRYNAMKEDPMYDDMLNNLPKDYIKQNIPEYQMGGTLNGVQGNNFTGQADPRFLRSDLVNYAVGSGQNPIQNDYWKSLAQMGISPQDRGLANYIIQFNNRPDIQGKSAQERISSFYSIPSGNPQLQPTLDTLRSLGSGPSATVNNSPDVNLQGLLGKRFKKGGKYRKGMC